MRRAKLLLIAGLSLAGLAGADAVAAGEVYQWKDASGVTHYSQTPPPKGQYQQRQITDKGAAAPQRVEAATAKPGAENAQCATARANLEALKGSNPVHEADADGKPGRALSDGERSSQLELANAAVKAYCNQPAG